MNIREFLSKINETKWGFLFYIVIVVPMSVLFYVLGTCLFIFFVVFAMMAIPYYMGLRKPKRFAILGVFVLVLNSLAFGGISTQRAYDYAGYYGSFEEMRVLVDPQENTLRNLTEGTVSPRTGDANTQFTYAVVFTNNLDIPPKSVSVVVSDSLFQGTGNEQQFAMSPVDPSDTDYTDGVLYEVRTTLSDYMDMRYIELPNHFFNFEAEEGNSTLLKPYFVNTTFPEGGFYRYGFGPMNAPPLEAFQPNTMFGFANMIWTIALFYLVVLMYWWLGRAKERSQMWKERMEEMQKEEYAEFECDRCGSDVPGDAEKCPRCGATFDEEEEEKGEDEEEEEEEEDEGKE
jgi:uncharacterized membrane protein